MTIEVSTAQPPDSTALGRQSKHKSRSYWLGRLRWLMLGSIRRTLIMVLLAAALPTLLMEIVHYRVVDAEQGALNTQTNLALARSVSANFGSYIDDLLRTERNIGLMLSVNAGSSHLESLDLVRRVLPSAASDYPALRGFSWADPNGNVRFAMQEPGLSASIADRPFFKAIVAGQDWAVSDLVLGGGTETPAVVVARGVRDDVGALKGVVVGVVDARRLSEVLGVRRAGQDGIALLDPRGQVAYPALLETPDWVDLVHPDVNAAFRRAIAGEENSGSFRFAGREQLTAFAPIGSIGWASMVSRPVPEATAQERLAEGVGALSILLVALFVARAIARTMTVPIKRLREYTIAVGNGQLAAVPAVSGPSEVVDLADGLDRMAKAIQVREDQLTFLAEANNILASSRDYDTTLANLAKLAVPFLADCCVVAVTTADATENRVAVAHQDPAKAAVAREMFSRYPLQAKGPWSVPTVQRLISAVDDHLLHSLAIDPGHLAMLRELGLSAILVSPLVAHGPQIGVVALLITSPDRRFGPVEIETATVLSRRAALAVDNAELFRRAAQAVRARDEFLSVAAHELRTPVTNLRGFAEAIVRQYDRDGTLDPERVRRALEAINRQSIRLARLVVQLLDVSRMETGKLALDPQDTDIVALVRAAVESAQSRTDRHTIVLHCPEILPVCADALRLEQVLANLLDNAIKYSPNGGPIDVDLHDGKRSVSLTVRDHGIGVPPEHRDRIFDRFYQVHGGPRFGGMGLGLYISRQIAELHGGELVAEFPDDGGARFVLHLPAALEVSSSSQKSSVE